MNREQRVRHSGGRQALVMMGWLALTFFASLSRVFVKTGGWYAELAKPVWHPPSWVFAPVWTTLYIMMAVAAWLVWQRGGWKAQRGPLALYLVQWALNAAWTPLFFGLQRPDLAFAEIIVLAVAIYATLMAFWRVRPVAGLLLVPYALWTSYAAVLNFTIWRLNV